MFNVTGRGGRGVQSGVVGGEDGWCGLGSGRPWTAGEVIHKPCLEGWLSFFNGNGLTYGTR